MGKPCEDTEAEGHVKMETKLDFMEAQSKGHPGLLQPPDLWRGEKIFPKSIQRRCDPADKLTLDISLELGQHMLLLL